MKQYKQQLSRCHTEYGICYGMYGVDTSYFSSVDKESSNQNNSTSYKKDKEDKKGKTNNCLPIDITININTVHNINVTPQDEKNAVHINGKTIQETIQEMIKEYIEELLGHHFPKDDDTE